MRLNILVGVPAHSMEASASANANPDSFGNARLWRGAHREAGVGKEGLRSAVMLLRGGKVVPGRRER